MRAVIALLNDAHDAIEIDAKETALERIKWSRKYLTDCIDKHTPHVTRVTKKG